MLTGAAILGIIVILLTLLSMLSCIVYRWLKTRRAKGLDDAGGILGVGGSCGSGGGGGNCSLLSKSPTDLESLHLKSAGTDPNKVKEY